MDVLALKLLSSLDWRHCTKANQRMPDCFSAIRRYGHDLLRGVPIGLGMSDARDMMKSDGSSSWSSCGRSAQGL